MEERTVICDKERTLMCRVHMILIFGKKLVALKLALGTNVLK